MLPPSPSPHPRGPRYSRLPSRPDLAYARDMPETPPRPTVTVTEEPGPVLRVWHGHDLAAETNLEPDRALALAEQLLAAARRVLILAKTNANGGRAGGC